MRLIHTADCHGTDSVFEMVESLRRPDSLLLDSGDTLLGSNTAFRWNEPNLKRMSALGYRAMTMGNRELHYVPAVLERRASQRNFPLLAANLIDLWGRAITWQDGLSCEVDGVKVGIFGMTVVQYPVGSLYEKLFGLRFLPPDTLIEHFVKEYRKAHDVVIFLSHLGLEWDRKLAKLLQQKSGLHCDLILGGHTHLTLAQPERHGRTLISHIGSHSSGLGCWDFDGREWSFEFHKAPDVVSVP